MKKKVLVIGAGFLGKNVIKEFENQKYDVIGTSSVGDNADLLKMDITSSEDLQNILKIKPDIVINCAAKTNLELLEKNPDEAFAVNSDAVKNISKICNKLGAKLIHISTDSVFDGKRGNYVETDISNPINVYAKSKLEGEKNVKEICKNFTIIRTNFYGIDGNQKFLFEKMFHNLKNGEEITGFDDVVFSPLEIKNLSKMILEISEKNISGVLHLASNEFFSKYEFCKLIAKIFSFDENLIKKGSIDDWHFNAKRPKNTTLNNEKSKKIIECKITKFEDWLISLKKSKVEI